MLDALGLVRWLAGSLPARTACEQHKARVTIAFEADINL
jgi:hypothetical protein